MLFLQVLGECADCVELPNIDDPTNHLEVVEYVDDIYQYYWIMEVFSFAFSPFLLIIVVIIKALFQLFFFFYR